MYVSYMGAVLINTHKEQQRWWWKAISCSQYTQTTIQVGFKPHKNCCLAALQKSPVVSTNRVWNDTWIANKFLFRCCIWLSCPDRFPVTHVWHTSLSAADMKVQLYWLSSRFVAALDMGGEVHLLFRHSVERRTWCTLQDGCFMWISWLCYISG